MAVSQDEIADPILGFVPDSTQKPTPYTVAMQAPQDPAAVQRLYDQLNAMGYSRVACALRDEAAQHGITLCGAQFDPSPAAAA